MLPFPFLFCQLLSRSGVIHRATVADKEMLLYLVSHLNVRSEITADVANRDDVQRFSISPGFGNEALVTKETQWLVKRNIESVQRAISPLNYGLGLPLFTLRLSNVTPVCMREPASWQFIFPLVRKQLKVTSWAKARVIVG